MEVWLCDAHVASDRNERERVGWMDSETLSVRQRTNPARHQGGGLTRERSLLSCRSAAAAEQACQAGQRWRSTWERTRPPAGQAAYDWRLETSRWASSL